MSDVQKFFLKNSPIPALDLAIPAKTSQTVFMLLSDAWQLYAQLYAQLHTQLSVQLYGQLYGQRHALSVQLYGQLYDQLNAQLLKQP
jgi:hypothetical protein